MNSDLQLQISTPVKAQNAGLFISRGQAVHPTRTLESHELIFVSQGCLDMREDDHIFHLQAGHVLHLLPHREHSSIDVMPPDLRFYWIHFDIDDESIQQAVPDSEGLHPQVKIPQTTQLARPDALERLFRMFINAQETGVLHATSANLLTTLMLVEVAQQAQDQSDSDNLNTVATWAHSYIRMNFDRPISASKVAEAVGYNVDYLGRIYRQSYDCTLTDAIHQRRVQKACDYLLNSNLNIAQIASKCGFRDPDYFRRIFKRYIKITPVEYRDENSPLHVTTH